jgi:uncharacterized membrane protein YebE (DUF533 family)
MLNEVLVGVLNIDTETGNLSRIVRAALEDGVIDEKEADDISDALKTLRSIERKLEVMLQEHKKEL